MHRVRYMTREESNRRRHNITRTNKTVALDKRMCNTESKGFVPLSLGHGVATVYTCTEMQILWLLTLSSLEETPTPVQMPQVMSISLRMASCSENACVWLASARLMMWLWSVRHWRENWFSKLAYHAWTLGSDYLLLLQQYTYNPRAGVYWELLLIHFLLLVWISECV